MVSWFLDGFHDNPVMVSGMQNRWVLRGMTFVLWALLAGSAAFWALRLNRPPSVVAAPVPVPPAVVDPVAVGRLLGYVPQAASAPAVANQPNLAGRFVLTGVVAGSSRGGAALIAVDGQPPRPFRVGRAIEEGVVLQSVQGRSAVLAAAPDGAPLLTLELPQLQR